MNIFNPLSKIFKPFTINYDERIRRSVEEDFYTAKLRLINAAQVKQQASFDYDYQQARVKILAEALENMKGAEVAQISTINPITPTMRGTSC